MHNLRYRLQNPLPLIPSHADERRYTAAVLRLVLVVLIIIDSAYALSHIFTMQTTPAYWLVLGAILLVLLYACLALLLLNQGYVLALRHPTCLIMLAVPIFIVVANGTLSGPFAMGGIMLAVVVTGVLHAERVVLLYTLFGITAAASLYIGEFWGQNPLPLLLYNVIAHSGLLIIVFAVLTLAGKTLRELIDRLSISEETLALRNAALEREIRERQYAETLIERMAALSPDPFVITTAAGEILYTNPAFADKLGYTPAELRGKQIRGYVHPDDDETTRAVARLTEATGEDVVHFENRYRARDGAYRWYSWNARHAEGIYYCFARDITQEKLAQQALLKSQELLNQTGSMAKVGGWEYDVDSKTLIWTAEMYAIYEVPPDFVPTRDAVIRFYTPSSQEKIARVLADGAEHGTSWDLELEIITAHGGQRWVRDIGSARRVDGRITTLYGTFQDITDRKEAELALLEREQHLSLALSAAEMNIWIWHFDTDIIVVSNSAVPGLAFRQQHYNDFIAQVHPDDRAGIQEAVRVTIEQDVPYSREYRYQRPDEPQRWVFSRGSLTRDSAGNPVGIIGVTHDITQRKLAEQQQLDLVLARQRAHFLTEFLGNISHDLKTPLTVISSSLYLIERLTDPERRRQKITQIEGQVLLLEKYIQDMITISRLENLPAAKTVPVNINDLLQSVGARIHDTCERKKLHLEWHLAAEGVTVLGDDDELHRAFVNLLENAANYTPESGTITVSTTVSDQRVHVQITDTGIGIPEADLVRVFERFYRSEEARQVVLTGTGLGLAIVKKIVELHQGLISVQSTLGKGTTFTIQLPSAPHPGAPARSMIAAVGR